MVDKKALIRNFSRHAHLYDRFANIQNIAAVELINQMPCDGITNILEVGCGTGNYTLLLRERFKVAYLKAIDISDKMVEIASRKLEYGEVEFIVGDAEEMKSDEPFDLITSNAAFQWFENIRSAIANYKDALTEKGIIAFSVFGPLTFRELAFCLKKAISKDTYLASSSFLEKDLLGEILSRHFSKVDLKELMIKEVYPDLNELLKKIKYTGVRGDCLNYGLLWKRGLLKNIEDIYKEQFDRIEASYQIFFCKAVK